MKIDVFDTETTGLDPAEDRVVEYAQVSLAPVSDGNLWTSKLVASLCDPQRDIPPEAKAVHHITEAMVAGKPVAAEFIKRIDFSKTTHLAAHNAQFDLGFVGAFLPDVPVIDTWRVAAHKYPQAPGHSNQVLRYWLGIEPHFQSTDDSARYAHRAGYDAIVTAAILAHMINEFGLDDVVRLSDPNMPVLQWLVRKTKYRGQPWKDMDIGFCRWVMKANPPFDIDTLHSARYQSQWLLTPPNARPEWGEPFNA